jgi:Tol biopolymer transport system component
VRAGGRTLEIRKPDWFTLLTNVSASPDGKRLAYTGWDAATYDTLRVDVVPLDGSAAVRWAAHFGESGHAVFQKDGSLMFPAFETQESVTLYRITGAGQEQRLGTVPRPVTSVIPSRDPRRLTVVVRDYHGDAWMSRVVKH